MAENKKSVLLYCDVIHTVKELTNEEAGKLFKHYLEYINDLNPTAPDKLTQIVFEPIKQNLKRDLKKWEQRSVKNSGIAKDGWIKRKDANACERINSDAKHADKDKVTDTVKVKDKVTDTDINKFSFKNSLLEFSKNKQLVEDWILVRKNKKATNSKTAFDLFMSEVNLSDISIDEILRTCVEKSWSGYKFKWIINLRTQEHKEKSSEKKESILHSIVENRNKAHDLIDLKYGNLNNNDT